MVSSKTKTLIDEEISKCDTRASCAGDERVFDNVYCIVPDYYTMLGNLYWRARRQSTVWDCFSQLVNCGFLTPRCLELPVDLRDPTYTNPHVKLVTGLLRTFENPCRDDLLVPNNHIPGQGIDWYTDLTWLAVMIVRGGHDFGEIFVKLIQTGYLGYPLADYVSRVLARHGGLFPRVHFDLETLSADKNPSLRNPRYKSDNSFGFILPHGIGCFSGSETEWRLALDRYFCPRFNVIEEAYRIETDLSQDQLLLEREQDDYYKQHPDRLPAVFSSSPNKKVADLGHSHIYDLSMLYNILSGSRETERIEEVISARLKCSSSQ